MLCELGFKWGENLYCSLVNYYKVFVGNGYDSNAEAAGFYYILSYFY
jgi:hypothetical protein